MRHDSSFDVYEGQANSAKRGIYASHDGVESPGAHYRRMVIDQLTLPSTFAPTLLAQFWVLNTITATLVDSFSVN
ncbi:hypothetical protein CCUS01_14036 [Colletotrichum cuscutae]|uniref:Uncharacterized protein n=1 Tax=Colletotrichum cuscutae TaxID=1209917 RepID=A0AAI9YA75_9PEZI|nr:hypothetical protein CCUS01_14036 [Colletotrichum cuscutae]